MSRDKGPRLAWWRYFGLGGVVVIAAFGGPDRVDAIFERWSRRDDPRWWSEYDAAVAERDHLNDHPVNEERWEWRLGATARDREIGVEIGCTGSPMCCAAIHIRRTRASDPGKAPAWEEIHLTPEECAWVIGELQYAVRRMETR